MMSITHEKYVRPHELEILGKWDRPNEAATRCGIKKTRLYQLLNEANGKIKTCLLKSPGAKKGARLIHLPSLFAYLEQMAEEQRKG